MGLPTYLTHWPESAWAAGIVDRVSESAIIIRTKSALDVEYSSAKLRIKGKKKVWGLRVVVLRLKRWLSDCMLACDR